MSEQARSTRKVNLFESKKKRTKQIFQRKIMMMNNYIITQKQQATETRGRERERDRNQKYHRLNSSATIGHALYLFKTNCYFRDVQENNTPATHARTHKMHILHLIFCVCDFKSKQLEQLHFKCLA